MAFFSGFFYEQLTDLLSKAPAYCLVVCVFAVVFYLYHLPLAAVMYPALICCLLGCLFMGRSICGAYGKHRELKMKSLSSRMPLR
ncbi:MAG: hypothetical protein K2G51_07335 [Lachnospiraceae bacterium]|nr:hypothetical protein [Lachnospiraceae bacterium]MDE7271942.1 hypothetical protein [Lachnospiraceae bacterium]